jgi:hypothetical protein
MRYQTNLTIDHQERSIYLHLQIMPTSSDTPPGQQSTPLTPATKTPASMVSKPPMLMHFEGATLSPSSTIIIMNMMLAHQLLKIIE